MREPMIGSLIYGDHKIPKKRRPWKERYKLPLAVGVAFIALSVLAYEFCNFREERAVRRFLGEVFSDHLDTAFSMWDLTEGSYTMKDFDSDWGKDGYYRKGVATAKVIDSNSKGRSVIVYVDIDTFKFPLALRVDRETLKLSYSPNNKYRARASR